MLSLLLAVPSCICSFWHGVIPTSYFIFILVSLIFLSRLSLDCSARRDAIRIYTSIKIIKNEVGCRDDTVPKTVDTRRHCEEE